MFKRKIYSKLMEWKTKSKGTSALLVKGARRVGKSTIVEEFAKNEYNSYILIDFMQPRPGTIELFESYSHDIGLLTSNLSILYNVRLKERDSLIVFDEVQKYPRARELIKYLVQDGRYDYLETGSLISIKANVKDIQIPSEEEDVEQIVTMYPMDFEEWLWANSDHATADLIRSNYIDREPLGPMHKVVMDKYRLYMMTGGMPGAVSAYLKDHDLTAAERVKRQIITLYRNDILKNTKDPNLTLSLFDSVPSMLSAHSKVFSPGKISEGTLSKDYQEAFEWLFESMILLKCVKNNNPNILMNLDNDASRFKAYLMDTGLLLTMALDTGVVDRSVFAGIAKSKFGLNKGMLFENMVAQELRFNDRKLYFSEFYSNGDEKHLYEVDFITIRKIKLVPVEVKSSSNSSRHKSLDLFIGMNEKKIGESFVVHPKDLMVADGITYVPIYMASLL